MPHQCTNCGHVFEDGSKEMLSGCPDCGGNKFQYHPGDVPEEPADDAEPPERDTGTVSGAVGRAANKVRDAVTSDPERSDASGGDPDSDAVAPETGGLGDAASDTGDDADSASPAQSASASEAESSASAESSSSSPETAASSTENSPAPETTPSSEGSESAETVNASTADSEDSAQASARSEVVDTASLPDAADSGRVVKEPDEEEDRPDLEDLRQELNDQFESIRIVAPGQYELNLMELYDRQEYIIALQEDGQYVIEVPDAWDDPEDADDA